MRILRGIGSRLLQCGCVGLYETYGGRSVALVDNHHPLCRDTTHHVNAAIDLVLLDAALPLPTLANRDAPNLFSLSSAIRKGGEVWRCSGPEK